MRSTRVCLTSAVLEGNFPLPFKLFMIPFCEFSMSKPVGVSNLYSMFEQAALQGMMATEKAIGHSFLEAMRWIIFSNGVVSVLPIAL